MKVRWIALAVLVCVPSALRAGKVEPSYSFGVPVVLFGGQGVASDAEPGYRETRSALIRIARRRGGGNTPATEAEQLLAAATNDDVADLARAYLCSRKDVAAVERAWQRAAPGSSAAAQRDRVRGRAEPVCPSQPEDCSVW